MDYNLQASIARICGEFGRDRHRLMDIVRAVQTKFGCVSSEMIDILATHTSSHRVEVEGFVSFYSFLSERKKGRIVIRLCNDVIDQLKGVDAVAQAFEDELRIRFGQNTVNNIFSLEYTACIGMCDQAPAALVNDVPVTNLTPQKAREVIQELRKSHDPRSLVNKCGDGNNSHELIHSMVQNNIREKGSVIFAPMKKGAGLQAALAMGPDEVIKAMKASRLRGRGGAGFSAGMKWEFTRGASGKSKVVICNADEGEPGTFKDRVILTECPDLLLEGMAVAAYAMGADTGLIYLRGEYAYLRPWLEDVIAARRSQGLLGQDILGKKGFNFDVRIQMGAGAYICGEESALINSCEGLRGIPRNRPPFPAQRGYLGLPTSVNNVETLCCAARIMEKGAAWFAKLGGDKSSGTKLLSIAGDCARPGVYELPFGITLQDVLEKAGAKNAAAVQVGGASGLMVPPEQFGRKICFDDLATGGALMVFEKGRDLLRIVHAFMEFFVDESCGYCVPCRVGNVLLSDALQKIIAGHGTPEEVQRMRDVCGTMKATSRCGLGQMAPNPVLSLLNNFKPAWEPLIKPVGDGTWPSFDQQGAVSEAEAAAGRKSVHTHTPE